MSVTGRFFILIYYHLIINSSPKPAAPRPLTPPVPYANLNHLMNYRPGTIARVALTVALPFAGGVLASWRDALWGAAAAALYLVPAARPYFPAVAATFGLLVVARLGAGVAAAGPVAVTLGFAGAVALALVVALWRGRRARAAPLREWVTVVLALGVVIYAGVSALVVRPAGVAVALAPLAAFAFLAFPPNAARATSPGPAYALAAGLLLAGVRVAVAFGLAAAADGAFARGDFAIAAREATWAGQLGAGARAGLTALKAKDRSGVPWPLLENLYARRDRYASPRPYDAALAAAALARGEYESAAMHADLATTPSPVGPNAGKPTARAALRRELVPRATTPFARAWLGLWAGDAPAGVATFDAADGTPGVGWWRAFARERAGRAADAAAVYAGLWETDAADYAAAFGLLRTHDYVGLRGAVWRALRSRYRFAMVGDALRAPDGYRLSKHRLSLGRDAATFVCPGPGRRPFALIAESFPAEGLYPIVTVSVNGRVARTFYLFVAGENIYETIVTLGAGDNVVAVRFENDYAEAARGLDRNVYVREVRLGENLDQPEN